MPRFRLPRDAWRILLNLLLKADAEAAGQSEAARAGLRAEAALYAAAERAGESKLNDDGSRGRGDIAGHVGRVAIHVAGQCPRRGVRRE